MNDTDKKSMSDFLVESIKSIVLEAEGPLLEGDRLWMALGYSSVSAFHQALHRKTLPVPVLEFPRRAQKFCLVHDVVQWLVEQRVNNLANNVYLNSEDFEVIPQENQKRFVLEHGFLMSEEQLGGFMKIKFQKTSQDVKMVFCGMFPLFRLDRRGRKVFALSFEILPVLRKINESHYHQIFINGKVK